MKDALLVSMLSLVPRTRAARWMGWLAQSGLSRWMVRAFVRVYGVDLSEASEPVTSYGSLESFFTRRLKAGVRPIDEDPGAMVSPCDGTVAAVGTTEAGVLSINSSQRLVLSELLDGPRTGELDVAVIYLSPKDYHRVHVPREGTLVGWRYVPGDLWPVFPAAVRRVRGLFQRNERMVAHIETSRGVLDVVLVGAFGVGRIELEAADVQANTLCEARQATCQQPLARGADLGAFHLGSTVIVVAPAGTWSWNITEGQTLRMGQAIAN